MPQVLLITIAFLMSRSLLISITVCLSAFVGIMLIGAMLSASHQVSVGEPPSDLDAETISIAQTQATPISGWFIPASKEYQDPQAGILLLHGVRSDRREMIDRARFLKKAGYSVLMIDMQAHGQTAGQHITFGYRESRSVKDALTYLRTRLPNQALGVIAISMGGAASLLGEQPVKVDALILEAVYSSIDQAVKNRLEIHLGAWSRYFANLLLWQIQPRLGINRNQLSPLVAIKHLQSPVLIMAGSMDQHTLLSESTALFEQASEPKSLWIVEGAAHEDLYDYAPQAYQQRVLVFLQTHLGNDQPIVTSDTLLKQ